jgi:hypothetical protein
VLISAFGVSAIEGAVLEGIVRFSFDSGSPRQIGGRITFGDVLSVPVEQGGGGFVVSDEPRGGVERVGAARVTLNSRKGRRVVHYDDGTTQASLELPAQWHEAIDTGYGVRVGKQRYVFVKWPADEKGIVGPLCAHNFTLYRVGRGLETVAHLNYGCDP